MNNKITSEMLAYSKNFIVNTQEIERLFDELMDKFRMPRREIVYKGSYRDAAILLNTNYAKLEEAFDTLDEDTWHFTWWGIWYGIWDGLQEVAKPGEYDDYIVGWYAGRVSLLSNAWDFAEVIQTHHWYDSSTLESEEIMLHTFYPAFYIGRDDVIQHKSNKSFHKTLSDILSAIKLSFPQTLTMISRFDRWRWYKPQWYRLPILLWCSAKAAWRAKILFKGFSELYKNGLFTFWILKDRIVYCVNPGMIITRDGQLHNEKKEAVTWANGEKYWFLNGVKVTQEIVETPAEKLDPKIILTEENAEVRREIVRKIGIERICYKLNAEVIDRSADGMYELLLLDCDDRERPYLKMRNPSINTYHIEGVGNECQTVAEALAYRMSRVTDKGIVISENGQDWYQQGDVIVYPKGAKVLKPEPVILT